MPPDSAPRRGPAETRKVEQSLQHTIACRRRNAARHESSPSIADRRSRLATCRSQRPRFSRAMTRRGLRVGKVSGIYAERLNIALVIARRAHRRRLDRRRGAPWGPRLQGGRPSVQPKQGGGRTRLCRRTVAADRERIDRTDGPELAPVAGSHRILVRLGWLFRRCRAWRSTAAVTLGSDLPALSVIARDEPSSAVASHGAPSTAVVRPRMRSNDDGGTRPIMAAASDPHRRGPTGRARSQYREADAC